MSAIFNFQSLLSVLLLVICTCTYLRVFFPSLMDRNKVGLSGTLWKCARIGERKSPWVAASCILMALSLLFLSNWARFIKILKSSGTSIVRTNSMH